MMMKHGFGAYFSTSDDKSGAVQVVSRITRGKSVKGAYTF